MNDKLSTPKHIVDWFLVGLVFIAVLSGQRIAAGLRLNQIAVEVSSRILISNQSPTEQSSSPIFDMGQGNAQVARLLGALAQKNGQNAVAIEYYERASTLEPHDVISRFQLAQVYDLIGNHDKAVNLFRQVHAEQYFLQRALAEYQSSSIASATNDLEMTVLIKPDDGNLRAALGSFYWLRNQRAAAVEEYRRALESDACKPIGSIVMLNSNCVAATARLEASLKNWDASIQAYEILVTRRLFGEYNALFLTPHMVWIEFARAFRDGKGDEELAENVIQRALVAEPNNVWLLIEVGRYYQETHEWERSLEFLNRASAGDVRNPYPEVWIGQYYFDQGQLDDAELHFRKALERKPVGEALYGLGRILQLRGDEQSAVPLLEQASQLLYEFPDAHLHAAEGWLGLGQYCAAYQHFQHVLKFDASNIRAQEALDDMTNHHLCAEPKPVP